jgi:hypothetical protein
VKAGARPPVARFLAYPAPPPELGDVRETPPPTATVRPFFLITQTRLVPWEVKWIQRMTRARPPRLQAIVTWGL